MPDHDTFQPVRTRRKKRRAAAAVVDPETFSARVGKITDEIANTEWMKECRNRVEACFEALGWDTQEVLVLCLGLGSPMMSKCAAAQLAFLASICGAFRIAENRISFFDPQFNEEDVQGLLSMGFHVLTENHRGKHTLESRTVLFMPHCGIELYENVLRENWHAENLRHLVLLGNALHDYATATPASRFERQTPCLSRIWRYLRCDPIPPLDAYPLSFNNMGLQYIDVNSFPSCKDPMWELPPPTAEKSFLTELI